MSNLYIDLGSTNIKWQQDEGDCRVIPFPAEIQLKPPFFEVSITKIRDIVLGIIENARCNRLFISVQMHGYILLDIDGKELTEYISWQDNRSELVDIPFTMLPENGVSMKPNLPRASVYAIKMLNNGLYSKAYSFCTLGSYLVYILTGVNKTHITDAASSGFYNVITGEGAGEFELPLITKNIEPAGVYKGITVYTPVGDQQAAVLGSGADERAYIMNVGTAGQMCCINNAFISGEFESRPYFNGKTLCTVSRLIAGKEIKENNDFNSEAFYLNYFTALKKLPPRKEIIVTGGVVSFYKKHLIRVLDKIALPYKFNEKKDAIEGLKVLSKEIS